MNHKTIRLGGRSYVILSFTPATAKRIITTLRGLEAKELKDLPDGLSLMAEAVSIAIAGSGILSRFKAFRIKKQIIRHSKTEELIQATGDILEFIPTTEFYTISKITEQFNQIISK